ncbi:hypothetical protein RQN30_03185 [Arcanobacterium hippocoleae]
MTKYLDIRKAAIAALQDYPAMDELANQTSNLEIEQIRQDLESPGSPRLDGMPKTSNPHAGETRIAAGLDEIDLIQARTVQAKQYLEWFDAAWARLTDDDRYVLEGFFLSQGSQEEAVQELADHYYVERDSIYRKKNRALDRLATLLYWR